MATAQVDPFASVLKSGDRPDCSGLVLVVGWSWGKGSDGYKRLSSEIAKLDDACHAYNGDYTHCTVATLSSFKNPRSVFFHSSPPDRSRVIDAWHQALTAAFSRRGGLPPPFKLVFRSLETSPAAAFLEADDTCGTMESLRSAVKEAAEDPLLSELSAELENKYKSVHSELCSIKDAIHVPDIVHSTVMRFASQPSDAGRLAEGLAGLNARWEPATVDIREMTLVNECHPYMHQSREGSLESQRYVL